MKKWQLQLVLMLGYKTVGGAARFINRTKRNAQKKFRNAFIIKQYWQGMTIDKICSYWGLSQAQVYRIVRSSKCV